MTTVLTGRYKYTRYIVDDISARETTYVGTREPIEFEDDSENTSYVVRAGDTLQTIANKFFGGFPDPPSMWWIIAEFQPVPIKDPTLRLKPGSILTIPSRDLAHDLVHVFMQDTLI